LENPNLLKPESLLDWRLVWWPDRDRRGRPSSFSGGWSSLVADNLLWQVPCWAADFLMQC